MRFTKIAIAGMLVGIAVAGGAAWLRAEPASPAPLAASEAPRAEAKDTSSLAPTEETASSADASAPAKNLENEGERDLMNRLRTAYPDAALALARQGDRDYPESSFAEERGSRAIDALVALGRIGEAHGDAMRFIEAYPAGPFSQHVMNLMGVHPRPAGALPSLKGPAPGSSR